MEVEEEVEEEEEEEEEEEGKAEGVLLPEDGEDEVSTGEEAVMEAVMRKREYWGKHESLMQEVDMQQGD